MSEDLRIVVGDCRNMKELDDNEVDLVVTSSPYWNAVDYDQHIADPTKWYRTRRGQDYNVYLGFLQEAFQEVYRVTKPGAFCCVVIGTVLYKGKHYPLPFHFVSLMEDIGFEFHQDIVWHKVTGGVKRAGVTIQNPKPLRYYPNIMTEFILVFKKPGVRKEKPGGEFPIDELFKLELANNVWHIAPVPPGVIPHPTPFPEEIPFRLIMFYSFPGDLVLDPFLGSGTTLKVARHLGRRGIGYEIRKEYAELAKRRIWEPLHLRDPLIAKFVHLSEICQMKLPVEG